MSQTYNDYEEYEDSSKDSPVALVGMLVMALTAIAIIANALFMQTKSAELALMTEATKSAEVKANQTHDNGNIAKPGAATGGDAMTLAVQTQLSKAGYYAGPKDGRKGARTREAILAFDDAVGVPSSGEITQDLYDVLMGRISVNTYRERHAQNFQASPEQPKQEQQVASKVPANVKILTALPRPKPARFRSASKAPARKKVASKKVSTIAIRPSGRSAPSAPVPPEPIPMVKSDPTLAKVQSALARIGYGNLTVDGKMGSRTSAAISEFQRRRGHPVTGRMDDRLVKDLIMMGYLDLG